MPDPVGKKVLVFGDSLSAAPTAPGGVMAAGLGASEIRVNAKVGRSAINFYAGEDAATQLAAVRAFDPDLVVVVLGTNDIGMGQATDRQAMAQLRRDLESAGATSWAFGPPTFPAGSRLLAGEPAVVATMKGVWGSHFIDLRPLTADLTSSSYRTSDQVHFTAAGGKIAGQRMASKIRQADHGVGGAELVVGALIAYILFG